MNDKKNNLDETMKIQFSIVILLLLVICDKEQRQKSDIDLQTTDTLKTNKKETSYTDQQLEFYLDSIGNFTPSYFAQNVSFVADSIYRGQLQMNKVISQTDFSKLKQAINEEDEILRTIEIKIAKNIFGEIQVDSTYIASGKIPVTFLSFDQKKEDLNEYAICLGYTEGGEFGWSCVLYFFKKNKIIAKHTIYHRYGLELEHYKDDDGKTIIYYKENFGSGSGIWQFNFYFYKFYDDKLIPVLNELENGNLNSWGKRNFWLETFVAKTNPLTLKMVYHQFFYATKGEGENYRIIDDSTFVQFSWDEKSKTLIGNYEESKINKFKILTYYLDSNDLLFINTYYNELKKGLKDKTKRHIVLNYLNGVKNYYESK